MCIYNKKQKKVQFATLFDICKCELPIRRVSKNEKKVSIRKKNVSLHHKRAKSQVLK